MKLDSGQFGKVRVEEQWFDLIGQWFDLVGQWFDLVDQWFDLIIPTSKRSFKLREYQLNQ